MNRKVIDKEINKYLAKQVSDIKNKSMYYERPMCPKCSIPMCGEVKIEDDEIVQYWSCMKCLYEEKEKEVQK